VTPRGHTHQSRSSRAVAPSFRTDAGVGTMTHSSPQYDDERREVVGPPVVRCGVVRCGVVRCGVVRCGVVRCGVVRCGVVRCGVVRCDVHYWVPHLWSATPTEGEKVV
jgi:hypothetical protein